MATKLFNLLGVFAIATLLAVGGLLAYLVATDKLNTARVEQVAMLLRGEDPIPNEATEEGGEAAEVVDTTGDTVAARGRSADEIREAMLTERLQRASLERASRDVAARQELLDQTLQHLISEQEAFTEARTRWENQRKKLSQESRDEGFQRELEYVARLSPRQAKEHLVRTWEAHPADAVRLLKALDTARGQRILEQLKTPQEVEIMHELLVQLRLQNVDGFVAQTGKSADDTAQK